MNEQQIVGALEARGVRFQVVSTRTSHRLRVPIGEHRLTDADRAALEIHERRIVEFLHERLRRGIDPPIVCADCEEAGHIECGIPF